MSAIETTTQNSEAVELPREPTSYRHTIHSRRRFKENKRMMNGSIVRMAIEEGDAKPGDEPGTTDFVLSFGAMKYTVVVSNEPGSDGIHNIVTMFPNRF